ncbi:MAG TPA: hypothetical protein VGG45_16470 [Terracidiphilus sp.]|jgi:hypothetical protein
MTKKKRWNPSIAAHWSHLVFPRSIIKPSPIPRIGGEDETTERTKHDDCEEDDFKERFHHRIPIS